MNDALNAIDEINLANIFVHINLQSFFRPSKDEGNPHASEKSNFNDGTKIYLCYMLSDEIITWDYFNQTQ